MHREYTRRINAVIDYIDTHLDEPLDLQTLADVALFSRYHFHRIFKAYLGETLGEYIGRVRLERAMMQLRGSASLSVTEIALSCGFSSSAAFSKAFRAHFGFAPREARKMAQPPLAGKSNPGQVESNPGQASTEPAGYTGAKSSPDEKRRKPMDKISLHQLPALHLAYVRHVGYQKGVRNPAIEAAFNKVVTWGLAQTQGLAGPGVVVGIPFDDPDVTPPDKARYDACVAVPPEIRASGEIGFHDLEAGTYAVAAVDDIAEIVPLVERLYCGWLADNGLEPDDAPPLEVYAAPFKVGKVMDFCVRVRAM